MDSHAYVHEDLQSQGDISPERVSQELDEVIHSYDTSKDATYVNESFENDEKTQNGGISDSDQNKNDRRGKRGREARREMAKFENERERLEEIPKRPSRKRTIWDYLKISLIVLTILTFVLNVGPFNRFKGNPLFNQTRGSASRKYKLAITPIREVFQIIWPVIYAFQGLWMGLCIVAIFTKTKRFVFIDGMRHCYFTYLHLYPNIFPETMLIFYMLGQLSLTAYKFVNDKEELLFSFVGLILSSLFFHLSLIFATKGVKDFRRDLVPEIVEVRSDKLLRGFVWMLHLVYLNGIAIIATWQLVAFSLALNKYLLYAMLWKPDVTSAITVCILLFYVVAFFVVDVFIVDRPSRSLFTSYAALLAASGGSVVKLFMPGRWSNPSEVTKVQMVFLLIVVGAVILAKLVVVGARGGREWIRRRKTNSVGSGIDNL